METKRILFGEWRPDLPDTEGSPTSNLDMAYNVYSSSTGYAPFPEQKEYQQIHLVAKILILYL